MLPWFVAAVLGVVCAVLLVRLLGERAKRKQRGVFSAWPIETVPLEWLDPVFAPGPFGPGVETEVAFIGRGPMHVNGGTSDAEAWVHAVLAKRATRLFEFGTCTGKTAYLWSRNAPPDARVVTLTLAPSQQKDYLAAPGDSEQETRFALSESAYETFLYTGTSAESRIEQLYGDSKRFDESAYRDWADVVFVDGSHAKSYVESDSAKAMRIVRPGGLVIWHDYNGAKHAPGVFEVLNEMAKTLPLKHVRGTTFVAWRRPL